MLAIDAPDVVDAIRYIRRNASASLTVSAVLEHLAVSRRSLERQFRETLGRSPRSEICRVIAERAKDLLTNTELSIPSVAARCGYKRANHFTTMFRKQTGKTPTGFRRQTRLTN
jgi:LacI family transcriptional regulator